MTIFSGNCMPSKGITIIKCKHLWVSATTWCLGIDFNKILFLIWEELCFLQIFVRYSIHLASTLFGGLGACYPAFWGNYSRIFRIFQIVSTAQIYMRRNYFLNDTIWLRLARGPVRNPWRGHVPMAHRPVGACFCII